LAHDQLVADGGVVEAHGGVIDEGLLDVGEVHLREQLAGRPREAKHSRAVRAERTVAVEELQVSRHCGQPFKNAPATLRKRAARSSTSFRPSRIVTPKAELRPGSDTPMLMLIDRASSASVLGSMPFQ